MNTKEDFNEPLQKKRLTRKFLGFLPTKQNTPENRFNKAHLKAYLKGKKYFNIDKYGNPSASVEQEISFIKNKSK